jgi:hypothetical protein
MSGFPNGGVVLADVRVSFVDPRTGRVTNEIDGVQKVHRVAPNLGVAFSGSVEAGFFLVEDLKGWLAEVPDGKTWSPGYVATEWRRRLKRLWTTLDPRLTEHGFELLLVGAFPGEHPPFAHSDAFRFRAPEFELERLSGGHAGSIGSGSDIAKYAEMIESFADDHAELSEFSVQPFPGGPAGPMGVVLGELIDENPAPGISSQLVLCTVGESETSIFTVKSPRPELTTPPIASTMEEFQRLCSGVDLSATLATALIAIRAAVSGSAARSPISAE